jgi:hypothetical protein
MQFILCLARRGNEPRWRESLAISSFALIALGPCTLCRRPISCNNKNDTQSSNLSQNSKVKITMEVKDLM